MKRFLHWIVLNKNYILIFLLFFFLIFSFYPTIFELSKANKLYDKDREFILEHNYYWPDYNLYLSKIRQGWEGRWSALEKYTSEPHQGSLIQEFYVVLGKIGKILGLDPTFSYQLGRIFLSPFLLLLIMLLVMFYFPEQLWQLVAFIIILVSGSFPRIYTDNLGIHHVGRFMEWWSNIDALQRITFIPHILFGQVGSFFIFYFLFLSKNQLTRSKLIGLIILGNLVGLAFPPSLITLDSVIIIITLLKLARKTLGSGVMPNSFQDDKVLFLIFTAPSLFYIFFITKVNPWSALIDFHRTHPMMIPFVDYILGTGPIFFLGFLGAFIAIFQKKRKLQPIILWVITTFLFAIFFTHAKDQSPLRFTQTGLFIPLGILGAYFFYELGNLIGKKILIIIISLYILENLFMMKVSLDWQINFISQRVGANIPPVPYPPQTMYPLRGWMDGIRWLRDQTNPQDVILAEITAGNFIPAYAGNTVYFGQSNTVDYDKKQLLVDKFFRGQMTISESKIFLQKGKVNYVFFSLQEKEQTQGKNLDVYYPFLSTIYSNSLVIIYKV